MAEASNDIDQRVALRMRAVACRRTVHGEPTTILRDIELTIQAGERVQIVGPSGSGKSTLLRLINRLEERSAGELAVLGRPVEQWPVRELRRQVAMVFQEPSLLDRSVEANLRLPFDLQNSMPGDFDQRLQDAIAAAGVERDWLERGSDELSFGQRQRATLARALMSRPTILLMDEATAGLDPQTARQMLQRLADLQQRRTLTVLAVTHRLGEVEQFGGRLVVLIDGTIAADGPAEAILADPPDEAVADLLRQRED